MLAVTAAAVCHAPLAMPLRLRNAMVAILGVMLGSGFSPEMAAEIPGWWLPLLGLLPYTILSAFLGAYVLRRWFGYDWPTAYFSAVPGGLSEMILVGGQSGGDIRTISLSHATRVMLVVLILPFAFALTSGYEGGQRPSAPGEPLMSLPLDDLAILGICGVLGLYGAQAIKIPAAQLVGPMALSAAVHLLGWTKAAPPVELVAASQVVVGAAIGVRFTGTAFVFLLRKVAVAALLTLFLLGITLVCALAIAWPSGLPVEPLVLAYAPGGLAEMSLVALALSLDAVFVATHHIVRITLIVVVGPQVFRWLKRRGKARK